MSIQTEIERLETAKSQLSAAIAAKGVEVPDGTTLDSFADYVGRIVTAADVLPDRDGGDEGKLLGVDASGGITLVPAITTAEIDQIMEEES